MCRDDLCTPLGLVGLGTGRTGRAWGQLPQEPKVRSHHNALWGKNRRTRAEGEEMVLGQLAVITVILQEVCLEGKPISSEL